MKRIVLLILCGFSWLIGMYHLAFGQNPELFVQTGHAGIIKNILYSPDEALFATVDYINIKLWETKTKTQVRSLGCPRGCEIAFSKDGKFLIGVSTLTAISENALYYRKWDISTGELREYKRINLTSDDKDSSKFRLAAISKDGLKLAIANDTTYIIKLFDLEKGLEEILTTQNKKGYISRKFSFNDSPARILDNAYNSILQRLNEKGIEIMKFSNDAKTLTVVDARGILTLWNLEKGKNRGIFENCKTFSMNQNFLACGNSNNSIHLWNLKTREKKVLSGHNSRIVSLAFSPNGQKLISASFDKITIIWDLIKNTKKQNPSRENLITVLIAFTKDGKNFVTSDSDKAMTFWNTETMEELLNVKSKVLDIGAIAIAPRKRLLAVSYGYSINIWNLNSGERIHTFNASREIQALQFTHDENFLAGGGANDKITLWDLRNEQSKVVGNFPNWVSEIILSPDDSQIATSSMMDVKVSVFDIETEKIIVSENPDTITISSNGVEAKSKNSKLPDWAGFNKFGRVPKITGTDGLSFDVRHYSEQIVFINSTTGNEVASFIELGKNDWLVATPEGYFDGTPNAWKQLIWRFNNNTFDYGAVELYFNDFFYPNLLQDVLAGKSPQAKSGRELEKIDRRQPAVEIVSVNGQTKAQVVDRTLSDQRTVSITVEVADNAAAKKQANHASTSGAQDLRLFRNGSLVKVWHDDVFDKLSGCETIQPKQGELRRVRCRAEVPIIAGDNNFTAYAFNSSNVKSNDDTFSIKGAETLRKAGTLYVLAVGVNKYANPDFNLNFAVPDVEEIGAAIKIQQDKLAVDENLRQYGKTEIITLTDENATKENILLALHRFAGGEKVVPSANASDRLKAEFAKIKAVEPEDALIIYYAGHGSADGQRFYLMPHNYTGKEQNSLVTQGISDIELNTALEKVDAGKLLMTIDACQSGQALGAQSEGRGPMNSKGLAQLAYDKGMLILTAAQSQQAALEAVKINGREVRHGLLTYALLEAMKNPQSNADKDANRQLWEREWFDYAVEQVPQLQLEAMKQRRIDLRNGTADVKGRSDIIYLDGDDPNLDPEKRRLQTPRVFYRREPEINPLIVAKP